ncbi:hypothetical protein [Streptomyces sp. V1I6]|nr:hypothetical protein [Streptomyces sp. V1I6]MDQ0843072.1 hypothetical protein [Streptomyces sp. V1I6]
MERTRTAAPRPFAAGLAARRRCGVAALTRQHDGVLASQPSGA